MFVTVRAIVGWVAEGEVVGTERVSLKGGLVGVILDDCLLGIWVGWVWFLVRGKAGGDVDGFDKGRSEGTKTRGECGINGGAESAWEGGSRG